MADSLTPVAAVARFLGVIMPMRATTTDADILDRRAFVAGGVA